MIQDTSSKEDYCLPMCVVRTVSIPRRDKRALISMRLHTVQYSCLRRLVPNCETDRQREREREKERDLPHIRPYLSQGGHLSALTDTTLTVYSSHPTHSPVRRGWPSSVFSCRYFCSSSSSSPSASQSLTIEIREVSIIVGNRMNQKKGRNK